KRTAEDDTPPKKQKLDPTASAAASISKADNEIQNALNESNLELSEHEATDTSKDRLE
ncbi:6930_t:CDS:2, partial [Racocetra persica]